MNGKMFQQGDLTLYVASPAKSSTRAILLIHEYWGLTERVKKQADVFAEKGYHCAAIDLYNGKIATDAKSASEIMSHDDPKMSLSKLEHAVQWMRSDAGSIKALKLATIGFCFGGGYSMKCAANFGTRVQGSVIYYGMVPTDPLELTNVKCPLLGVFAKKDKWINPQMVSGFREACKKANVSAEIHEYDADHAFANPTNAHQDPVAAKDAAAHVDQFFSQVLGE